MKELAFSASDPEFLRHSSLDTAFSSLAYFRQLKWQITKESKSPHTEPKCVLPIWPCFCSATA